MAVASTHTPSRSASTHALQSHPCWLGLVLCQIRCCYEPCAKKSFPIRLSGCAVAAVGVQGMFVRDDLLAIGMLLHLSFTRQCRGGRGCPCSSEEQRRP